MKPYYEDKKGPYITHYASGRGSEGWKYYGTDYNGSNTPSYGKDILIWNIALHNIETESVSSSDSYDISGGGFFAIFCNMGVARTSDTDLDFQIFRQDLSPSKISVTGDDNVEAVTKPTGLKISPLLNA